MVSRDDEAANPDLTSVLEVLASAGVDFILVGGLAAVAQGAPVTTFDVDIVPARTPENAKKLLQVLVSLDAHHRRPGPIRLPPSLADVEGTGHALFSTRLGPLDVLGTIEDGNQFDDLIADSEEIRLGIHTVRVLKLEKLVELKRRSTHEKDRAALPVLEEALRQKLGSS